MIQVREFTNGADVLAHAAQIRRKFFPPRQNAPTQVQAVTEEPVPEEIIPAPTPKPDIVFPEDRTKWQEAAASPVFNSHTLAMETIARTAFAHGLTPDDLTGPSRKAGVVKARMAAIAAIYVALPHWSLPKIGKFFGGRDHTTCLHAVKKMGVWRQ